MATAGYSQTTLAKKLGIKEGFVIKLVQQPEHYFDLFTDVPADVKIVSDNKTKKDFIHVFIKTNNELHQYIPSLKDEIKPNGIIWVSWPKKASKIVTDITEDVIRDLALANKLVDVKVCAVDETWSGLKLVISLKYRI